MCNWKMKRIRYDVACYKAIQDEDNQTALKYTNKQKKIYSIFEILYLKKGYVNTIYTIILSL